MFDELEYKYRADFITLKDFKTLIEREQILKTIAPASWDIYYLQLENPDSFQRFRMDKTNPELTKKVKKRNSNNWERVESDLPLHPGVTEEQVAFHVGLDGYVENFRIFKICHIYFTKYLNFVYYTVFGEEMQPLGKFIEVEVNKDQVKNLEFLESGSSMRELRFGELVLKDLGISAQNRLQKSLFELFRKKD